MRHLRPASCLLLLLAAACGGSETPTQGQPEGPPLVGLLLDRLEHERWERDRDLFTRRVEELGGQVLVRTGDGDPDRQAAEATALLDAGAKVLVVVAADLERAGDIVAAAAARDVPVISYDRLIRNADVALYVSFDNVKVGRMQAEHLLSTAPRGNYLLLGGSPTDNNAMLVRQGQMEVLKPAIDSGDVRIAADPWIQDWSGERAREATAEALKRTRRLAAVVASNDAIAGGAIEALAAGELAGKVPVSGQDADLAACRRIVAGTQAMTVYKPLTPLARMAAGAAMSLVKGQPVDSLVTVNNGAKEVPARLMDPISVDKSNIDVTVISDGYHSREAVYGAAN